MKRKKLECIQNSIGEHFMGHQQGLFLRAAHAFSFAFGISLLCVINIFAIMTQYDKCFSIFSVRSCEWNSDGVTVRPCKMNEIKSSYFSSPFKLFSISYSSEKKRRNKNIIRIQCWPAWNVWDTWWHLWILLQRQISFIHSLIWAFRRHLLARSKLRKTNLNKNSEFWHTKQKKRSFLCDETPKFMPQSH